MWARDDLVKRYATRDLRPAEVMLLVRYREALAGRVLDQARRLLSPDGLLMIARRSPS